MNHTFIISSYYYTHKFVKPTIIPLDKPFINFQEANCWVLARTIRTSSFRT